MIKSLTSKPFNNFLPVRGLINNSTAANPMAKNKIVKNVFIVILFFNKYPVYLKGSRGFIKDCIGVEPYNSTKWSGKPPCKPSINFSITLALSLSS